MIEKFDVNRSFTDDAEGGGLLMSIRKCDILGQIEQLGVVGIIRTKDVGVGVASGEAMFRGGVTAVEVSTTYPGALEILAEVGRRCRALPNGRDLAIGAGTVADAETARLCILNGAEFIVSHCLSEDVARTCNRYGAAYMPGVGTVTELVRAMELGAEVVKEFPGDVLGPKFIKAVHGPVPWAKIMPIGGVSEENLAEWFHAGAFAVGLGTALMKPNGAEGDFDAVRGASERIVARIAEIRAK